jgi:DNA-binding MarR family transcriptional regulator
MDIEEIIERLSQSMERYETETLSNTPLASLTPTQVHYLDTIFHLENPNISELASHLNVSKPTVTFAINNMEKLGYVKKNQSDEDRRFFSIHLTSMGKKMAKLHDEIHKNYAEIFRQVLNQNELKTLEGLLEKVLKEI